MTNTTFLPKNKMSLNEYLTFQESEERKYEFMDGEVRIFHEPGGSENHSEISAHLIWSLITHKKSTKKSLHVFTSDLNLYIEKLNRTTFPDCMVVLGEKENFQNNKNLLTNPILIFEVLSDSTRLYDLNGKFEKYKHIPSFKEYVLVNQKKVEVEVRSLQENGDWTKKIYRKIEDKAVLTSIGFEMPLGDIYEGIL